MKQQRQIRQDAYKSGHGFINRYQKLIKDVVIPYQYEVLCDKVENTEKSHVILNFINAGKVLRGETVEDGFYGMVFQDSDAAKWIEAAAYSLSLFPDETLEETVDTLIDIIANAQDKDGYLNTYYTIKDKDKRWQNLMEGHELYCSGHMIEAACAYYEATGKDKLMQVMLKNVKHIYQVFMMQENEGFPGHPEIELALMKMYHMTGEPHCLQLAEHFINIRGKDPKFYEKEAKKRNWTIWGADPTNTDYMQSSMPVREQSDAVGHAVRAVYLYTAMADLASEIEDKELHTACDRLWKSIINRRMYLTGGIGSTGIGEAFSVDYDLPNDTAYAETCASIGLMCFASRMLELSIDRQYADIMEKAFYNTVLAGMQLDGKRFFYVNPLEVVPGIAGIAPTHRHDLPERPGWYTCACCPPNVARLISSFGKYAYGENEDTAFCHLYAEGEVSFENGLRLVCETQYPYDFEVTYKIISGNKKLAIRIPGWSKKYSIMVNGKKSECGLINGYVYLDVMSQDVVKVTLDGNPYFVYASSKVPQLTEKIAVCRGPLVYCFEGIDNEGDVLSIALKKQGKLEVKKWEEKILGNIVKITAEAMKAQKIETLYTLEMPGKDNYTAVAVPYYTWANRGINQMRVWMNSL
ncbi:MAG: glycoside hydrolase family 127 protein [Cellulosilyticum sp.]|nr:glycoside hydrolase family 127 protein [Cellulosilyticum sp.]